MKPPYKFPVVVIHTTASKMETRLVRDMDEYVSLISHILDDQTTVSYEVFMSYKLVTKTIEWKETPSDEKPWD